MTLFTERERALENKYIFEREHFFKARSRRNRLMATYVANLIGLEDKENYLVEIESTGSVESDEELIEKVFNDLIEAEVVIDRAQISAKLAECGKIAEQELGIPPS